MWRLILLLATSTILPCFAVAVSSGGSGLDATQSQPYVYSTLLDDEFDEISFGEGALPEEPVLIYEENAVRIMNFASLFSFFAVPLLVFVWPKSPTKSSSARVRLLIACGIGWIAFGIAGFRYNELNYISMQKGGDPMWDPSFGLAFSQAFGWLFAFLGSLPYLIIPRIVLLVRGLAGPETVEQDAAPQTRPRWRVGG